MDEASRSLVKSAVQLTVDPSCKMPNIDAINRHLQSRLARSGYEEVCAIEAAKWVDEAGLLKDSSSRPSLPLRNLLRTGKIVGQNQRPNMKLGRWWIKQRGG